MAKLLVLFYSRSGNTEKMAHRIAEAMRGVEGVEVTLRRIGEIAPKDWLAFDGIILGAPVYYGGPPFEVKQAIDESVAFHGKFKGKLGGAFASSANVGGGNETTCLDILHAWLIHGMIVLGNALGDHYGPVSIGAPDDRANKVRDHYARLWAETAKRLFG